MTYRRGLMGSGFSFVGVFLFVFVVLGFFVFVSWCFFVYLFFSPPDTVLLCLLENIRSGLYILSWKSLKIPVSGLCLCS